MKIYVVLLKHNKWRKRLINDQSWLKLSEEYDSISVEKIIKLIESFTSKLYQWIE